MKLVPFLAFFVMSSAHAEIVIDVNISPLPQEFKSLEPAIRSHVVAAAKMWVSHFDVQACDKQTCNIQIEFSIKDWPARGTGHSLVSVPLDDQNYGGKFITEEGAAHHLRTGINATPGSASIEIFFDPIYFRTLWFDPDPVRRTAPMPDRSLEKLDAMSVILHELGHAFGFNGFRNQKTGELPGDFLSAYDRWVTFDGENFYFIGPNARKFYGKPIVLAKTNNNYHHVGDKGDNRDPGLQEDLMNGIVFDWSHRYSISALDIAMLSDCGLRLKK